MSKLDWRRTRRFAGEETTREDIYGPRFKSGKEREADRILAGLPVSKKWSRPPRKRKK